MTDEAQNPGDGPNEETGTDSAASTDAAAAGIPVTDLGAADSDEVFDPVAEMESQRDAYRDTLQRLQADFENYRKRMSKQVAEASERANESFVTKLLSVLDTIDLAQAHDPNASVEQISTALHEVLSKEGLERLPSVGEGFDPTLHEAVAHEAGDGESRVTEEMRAGYRWRGRVIRPAMVKVVG